MATDFTSVGETLHRVQLACQPTPTELCRRKEPIIYSLKQQVVNRQELPTGFAYELQGRDAQVDEPADFVKIEPRCGSFFEYELRFGSGAGPSWLRLTEPAGSKDFTVQEPGM